jgi:aspartate/methionine/tyrosine aminotransferase
MAARPLSRRIRAISEPLIDTLARRSRALEQGGARIANLGQALPGDAPPRAALRAAERALRDPATSVYAPDAGLPELRAATAAWIARHDGIQVDPDTQLIITAGANQALMLALQCCTDVGDEVLLPAPYFMNHDMAVRLVDAVPREIATTAEDGWVITARRLFETGSAGRAARPEPRAFSLAAGTYDVHPRPPAKTLGPPAEARPELHSDLTGRASAESPSVLAGRRDRTSTVPPASKNTRGLGYAARPEFSKAVIVTTPNNPTGAVVPRQEVERIARECARRGAFLILDRTYAGFEYERAPEPTRLKRLPENVVLVGSFSKVFSMTGWRVGYLAGSPALIREALKAQDTTIICAPTIGQVAVADALRTRTGVAPSYLREIRRRRDYVQRRIERIAGWSAVPAAGGFFAFIRIDGLDDSVRFARTLLERSHVLVLPGRIFGEAGEGHIRLSYGIADVATLELAFDRLEALS